MREFPKGLMNLLINMLYGVRGQLTRSEAVFEGYQVTVYKMGKNKIRLDLTDMSTDDGIDEVIEDGTE